MNETAAQEQPDEQLVRPTRAPPHLFRSNACYLVTAKTLHGTYWIASDARKEAVISAFQYACAQRGWQLAAWVVLSNHYHCLLVAPESADGLSNLVASVHRFTATTWNRENGQPGDRFGTASGIAASTTKAASGPA